MDGRLHGAEHVIEVKNLVMSFGSTAALKGITLEVPRGEIFAFLGPNGAGKTTTIKIITTLLQPTAGTVCVDGLDVTRDQAAVRSRLGIVFQEPSLDIELTAWENLELSAVLYHVSRRDRRARAEELLRSFELWDQRDQLAKVFSGGMRRRLETARALLHRPPVLVLDEPTLGLDPQSRAKLWEQVRTLSQRDGVTVLFTTHYLEEAERNAQQLAIIDHGAIAARGTPHSIMRDHHAVSLEAAFLTITGTAVRDQPAGTPEHLQQMARMLIEKRMKARGQ
jgi:ABC-2 type transport system ATP-binding protein